MLTVFHDPTSPASAVVVARLTRLALEGLPITFEGFEAVGVDAHLRPDLDTLALIDRMADEAAGEGIVLTRPARLPPTGLAHVLLAYTETTAHAHAVRTEMYRTFWSDGMDLADRQVLRGIAARAGLSEQDLTHVDELLRDRVALASRRRQMTAHRREGVGGVPVLLASRTLVPALLPEDQVRALAASV